MILLDSREGSWQLARSEPLRSMLPPCGLCEGLGRAMGYGESVSLSPVVGACTACRGTGRRLSRITTSRGEGGPDVLIVGNGPNNKSILIAAEVKTYSDLFFSARTGRLQSETEGQLSAMLADYDQCWLVWYGTVRFGERPEDPLTVPVGRGPGGQCVWGPLTHNGTREGKPVRTDFLDGLLLAVAAEGVHVLHLPTERRVAQWLAALHRYWTKPYDEHTFTRTFNTAPRFPKVVPNATAEQVERAGRVFDRYPGLGIERALAAARHFPSVRAMANATEKEWMEVPGVGKGLAPQIVKAFGR